MEKHRVQSADSSRTEEENGAISSWIATEKQKLLVELEEVRSRCDELYADLADCQEQLRIEHLQQEIAHREKRIHFEKESVPYSQLLVQIDCQHVESDGADSRIERSARAEANHRSFRAAASLRGRFVAPQTGRFAGAFGVLR